MTEQQEKHRKRRQALRELSKLAKIKMQNGCDGMTVNEILVEEFYKNETHQDFKTLHQWNQEGFKVKKGAESFLVWGRPKSKQSEQPTDEEEDDFYPLCYLFSNAQVDKR